MVEDVEPAILGMKGRGSFPGLFIYWFSQLLCLSLFDDFSIRKPPRQSTALQTLANE